MRRRALLAGLGSGTAAAAAVWAFPHQARLAYQILTGPAAMPEGAPWGDPGPDMAALVAAAEAQVGVTARYDPAYVALDYPGGDVPRDRCVCTDVVIRALRDGIGLDLQALIHRDMAAHFAEYPQKWGLTRPDRNIDHRRVPNMAAFLTRAGPGLALIDAPADYAPGDIVTSVFPDGQTHVGLVSSRASADGARPLVVHNVGAGSRVEDRLFDWTLTGHFRLSPAVLQKLRA